MSDYQITSFGNVIRISDNAWIPIAHDPANPDFDIYDAWCKAGNTPAPYIALPPDYKSLALDELEVSDTTALRCFKAGMPFPSEWQSYTNTLRGIVRSGAGPLPTRPVYPLGT